MCPNIIDVLEQQFKFNFRLHFIEPELQIIIFKTSETLNNISLAHRGFMNYCLMSAKKCLLMFWKGKDITNVQTNLSCAIKYH